MAYLGKGTKSIDHATISTHTMTGDGSDTTMSITLGTTSVNNVSVFISGVQQRPGQDYTVANDVITFTTAPAAGWPVIAFVRKDTKKGTIADASVGLDTIKDGAVTDAKIVGLSASKLTGALPAIDGSALTGISAVTTSATDPAVDTNTTLGTVWVNKTSGNTFVCTDATTDANVWTNVGGGTDNIQPYVYTYYGTAYGYTAGGGSGPRGNVIDRFSFTSQSDAADVGDLTTDRNSAAGGKSETHGFSQSDGGSSNQIEKYSFAASANATIHGNLTAGRYAAAEASMSTHVYCAGGHGSTPPGGVTDDNRIDKFATASDSDSTDVGNLVNNIWYVGGNSSTTHGYVAGGYPSNNIIQKWSFASDGDASDIADLVTSRRDTHGTSSETHGYNSGNYPHSNQIEKFTFATDAHATDVGDMVNGDDLCAGSSASDYGYLVGGRTYTDRIQRYSNSSDGNAVDWADLSVATGSMLAACSAR